MIFILTLKFDKISSKFIRLCNYVQCKLYSPFHHHKPLSQTTKINKQTECGLTDTSVYTFTTDN